MNRPSIPPSPQSSAARKPLLNITSFYHNSVEELGANSHKNKLNIPRSESTTNVRGRINSGESSKLKELRHRKNSVNSNSSANQKHDFHPQKQQYSSNSKQKWCQNHKTRKASHQILEKPRSYFCLECALVLARKNIKIYKLKNLQARQSLQCQKNKNKNAESQKRSLQLNKYLTKSSQIAKNLLSYEQNVSKQISDINKQYSDKIKQQKTFMEQQIVKITEIYTTHIRMLQERKQQKIVQLNQQQTKVSNYMQAINNSQVDIHTAMDGIKNKLTDNQFEAVIKQYWNIIQQAQKHVSQYKVAVTFRNPQVSQFSIFDKQLVNSNMQNTCQANSDVKSRKSLARASGDNFTFSKKSYLETPEINKTLKGIKFANSIGQSQQHSSLRSSIVDSKFNFQ